MSKGGGYAEIPSTGSSGTESGSGVERAAGRGGAAGQRKKTGRISAKDPRAAKAGTPKDERKLNPAALYPPESGARALNEKDIEEPWLEDYGRVIHSPAFRRLQGKTQVFPGHESDFFRNRLTHSLEVARIAELMAWRINKQHPYFRENPLNTRICMIAGMVHDLGHPPFGHNGEHALDDRMRGYGGFEGNAQTLRIVGHLEKKISSGEDEAEDSRVGLNLTYRSLAAILKYDRMIPHVRGAGEALVKGYYAEEETLVQQMKTAVDPDWKTASAFKTVECQIMDIADDIAYSTFDLEDCFKAGFLSPATILSSDTDLLARVAAKVSAAMGDERLDEHDVLGAFAEMFYQLGEGASGNGLMDMIQAFKRSQSVATSGYLRTEFSCELIQRFLAGIQVQLDARCPARSVVRLDPETRRMVEILKNYVYEATIFSARVKVTEFRGYSLVSSIFEALSGPKGYLLMPDDVRRLHGQYESNATARMRIVCDFIAGMTDNYALEFYGRLSAGHPQSIFKPI
jgi:dGTPase